MPDGLRFSRQFVGIPVDCGSDTQSADGHLWDDRQFSFELTADDTHVSHTPTCTVFRRKCVLAPSGGARGEH